MALVLMLMPVSQAAAQNETVPGFQGNLNIGEYVTFLFEKNDLKWSSDFAVDGVPFTAPSWVRVVRGTAAPSNCTNATGGTVWGANPSEIFTDSNMVGGELNPAFYCVLGGWHGQNINDNTHISTPVIYVSEAWLLDFLSQINPTNYDFAIAYIIVHEYGHHVEQQLGHILTDGTFCCGRNSEQIELPADCLAGAWTKWAEAQGILTDTDVEEAISAAYLLGSDLPLPAGTPGDHGTNEERSAAYAIGYLNGRADTCMNTNLGW